MKKKIPIISLFIMSIFCLLYCSFKSKEELHEAKWNVPDTTIAITINDEISTTFPTNKLFNTTVNCDNGSGIAEWNGNKWILSVSQINKGNTKCNIVFKSRKENFSEVILANNEITTPETTPGKFAAGTNESVLASTEDDYGTSYYFRGNNNNNYVEFTNKCWRIVRIVGDGSVKLVLHNYNVSGSNNPCSSANNNKEAAFAHYDSSTYTTSFNIDYKDNAYIGFMYGDTNKNSYNNTHINTNKSTILTNLETWYVNNLISYSDKLADTIWCNDKSTVSGGLGYGTNHTNYATIDRVENNSTPSLICPNDNNGGKLSKFTVNDKANGNGNLTYKIGLLTADELLFAGYIFDTTSTHVYLTENAETASWWTLSPRNLSGNGVLIYSIKDSNKLSYYRTDVSQALRPSISLIPSTEVTGTGTSEDPYVVN